MLMVALFTIAKTWKQPKCPSTDEWIKKMLYIYIHTHREWNIIQPLYKNESLPFATTWKDLENITLMKLIKQRKSKIWYHYIIIIILTLSLVWLFVALWTIALSWPRDFPDRNTGVGCHFLLQLNFSTQGSNLRLLWLLHCQTGSLQLSHQGSLIALYRESK